ncbi:MAG: sensor histidine kinase [Allosphingosinicella sp.]|uniref:sensor histidine kinase n=1 Tax=Allosphingosinicella sp. TaxID=2823234 RepID=UPI00394B50AC
MDRLLAPGVTRRLPDLALALKTIAAFWIFYFALVTARGLLIGFPGQSELLERRAMATVVGAAITFLLYLAMQPVAQASLRRKATFGALICFPAAMAFAAFNFFVFYVYAPLTATWVQDRPEAHRILDKPMLAIADSTVSWYFFFAAWAALYVAMSYAQQLRAADRRAALLAREAQDAQLRALRYQINPHFLFNTLNSLSSLILSQRTDVAEGMIMNLSTFFRTTLSADPTADVPLEEEIKLQRLYLDIEKIRFPDRLHVDIDIPATLLSQRVPVLILQPAVENAVKYGVAKSRRGVTIRITAWEEAGRLHIKVKDDGEAAGASLDDGPGGTGVGLANVADRLYARYGRQAGLLHGADPEGGYTVHLFIPVNRDGE